MKKRNMIVKRLLLLAVISSVFSTSAGAPLMSVHTVQAEDTKIFADTGG